MARTIVICGYGPGISDAVARKFGGEGFQVALVGRNLERLRAGAEALGTKGITAKPFAGDLADTATVRELFASIKAQLGPVTVIHWNAYGAGAADLTTCDPAELGDVFDLSVTSLVVATQQALPDLKAQDGAAILVTGGGLGFHKPEIDKMAVSWGAMGLAIGKSAQHKLVGVLHHRLASEGVYVGEVVVLGSVKGTAFDHGNATLEPSAIATRFWEMYVARDRSTTDFTG
jgi:NADP-dependent 3-hydroxy acid dehydrogenase YdfG